MHWRSNRNDFICIFIVHCPSLSQVFSLIQYKMIKSVKGTMTVNIFIYVFSLVLSNRIVQFISSRCVFVESVPPNIGVSSFLYLKTELEPLRTCPCYLPCYSGTQHARCVPTDAQCLPFQAFHVVRNPFIIDICTVWLLTTIIWSLVDPTRCNVKVLTS